jgi:hypothetical protein
MRGRLISRNITFHFDREAFFILVELGFELNASHLLGRGFSTGVMPATFFALGNLEIGSHIDAWSGLDHDLPIYGSL